MPSAFLPLRVADVCPPASERCEGLHSTGITRLHRYTGPHPITNPLLPVFFFTVALVYSVRSESEPRACWPAWLTLSHNVLLDAVYDPGMESSTRPPALLPVACGSRESLSLSHLFHFGANYRIQRPTLHLATFLDSVVLDSL